MITRRVLLLATLALPMSVGCSVEPPAIPPGLQLLCTTAADCPAGTTCRTEVGRCVALGGDDVAPKLVPGSVSIEPGVLGPDGTLTVRFSLDEETLATPEVRLGTRPMQLAAQDGLAWTFTYRAGGSEEEGVTGVLLTASDRFGNVARDLSLGTAVFDFTAPVLSDIVAIGSRVIRAGVALTVQVTAAEELATPPAVTLGAGIPLQHESSGAGLHRYTYVATGEEDPGPTAVAVVATDDAGNRTERRVEGLCDFDFTAPLPVDGSVRFLTNPVRAGASAALTFAITEPVVAPPEVFLRNGTEEVAWRNVSVVGTEVSATHVIDGLPSGMYDIFTRSLSDPAGNDAGEQHLGTLGVDTTPPVITGFAASVRRARDGTHLVVAFTVDEPLSATPAVLVGGRLAALEREDGLQFDFALEVDADVDAEGLANVVVSIRDVAGNAASEVTTVEFDFTPPAVATSQAAPAVVKQGDDLSWSLQVTEPLADAGLPVLTLTRDGLPVPGAFGAPFARSATGFTWRMAGEDLPDGAYAVSVTLTDVAGNTSGELGAAGFVVDRSLPQVTGLVVSPGVVKEGDPLRVAFQTNEALAGPPTVLVAGRAAGVASSEDGRHAFLFTPVASDPEGTSSVVVSVRDVAGNAASAQTTVILDFTPPALAASQAAPALLKLGDDLTWSLQVTEPLLGGEPPSITLRRAGTVVEGAFGTPASRSATGFTWHFDGASLEDGTYEVGVALVDAAGNATAELPAAGFRVDRTLPRIEHLATSRGVVRADDAFTVAFDVEETLAADPVVTVAGRAASLVSRDGVRCTYRFTPLATDPEGLVNVVVAVRDEAGNTASEVATVEFDFTPPAIATSRAAPATVKLGDDLTWSLQVTERLAGDGLPTLVLTRDGAEVPGGFGAPIARSATGFTWQQAGLSLTDGTYAVAVSLVDVAGNTAGGLAAAGFTVDRRAPRITGLTTGGSLFRAGVAFHIDFDVDEALGADPVVTVGGRAATLLTRTATHLRYRFTPLASDPEGLATVVASVQDVAGNTASEVATVEFDFTPPAIATSRAAPATVKLGDDLTWSLQVTERLAGDGLPTLVLTRDGVEVPGGFGAPIARSATGFTWQQAGLALADGTYAVTVSLVDVAGNASGTLDATGFTVDRTQPLVTNLTTSSAILKSGATLDVDFDVNEALASDPVVTVDGRAATLVSRVGDHGRFRFVPDALVDTDGLVNVVVTVRDVAGNDTTEVRTVEFDFTAPGLIARSVRPSPAGLGAELTVSITPSETLATTPTLSTTGPASLEFTAVAGSAYSWSRTVTAADTDGTYTPTVRLTDRAGNTADVELPAFVVDARAPVLTNLATSRTTYGKSASTRNVSVSFDASETFEPARLAVTLGDAALACGTPVGAARTYTCTRTLSGLETPGATIVLVTASDAADNRTTASTTVTLDFTAPALLSASVAYVTGTDNVLGTVTAARAGTKLVITALANETLSTAVPPRLTLALGGLRLANALAPTTLDGTAATFEVTVPPGTADGTWLPTLSWQDVVENATATVTFATPPVRTLTTRPTLNVAQDQVTFLRSRWGNTAAETLGGFVLQTGALFALAPADPLSSASTLPANTFALAGGRTLRRIRIWSEGTQETLLGAAEPAADGNWPRTTLGRIDTPSIWVTGLDQAGNESNPVILDNAEWVATPNPTSAGTSVHELSLVHQVQPSLAQSTAAAGSQGTGADGQAMLLAGEGAWKARVPAEVLPSDRRDTCMAYDTARGRLVRFAGHPSGVTAYGNETWEWDGSAWSDRTPAGTRPPPRGGCAMAYDSTRGRVVLFGGEDNSASMNDLWEWDGTRWIDRTPASTKPPARALGGIAYDSGRQVLVIQGGWQRSGTTHVELGDTWEWNGTTWTARTGSTPGARRSHVMAYDASRQRTVLYGGAFYSRDTWEWDGVAWTRVSTGGPGTPEATFGSGFAFDPVRNRVVLFGGGTGSGQSAQTWEWDGVTWTNRTPASGNPAARLDATLVFDSRYGRLLLADTSPPFEFWSWDGISWRKRTPSAAAPSYRPSPAMAWDTARRRLVMFGGSTGSFEGDDQLWEWDGTAWEQIPPTGTWPGPRYGARMAYDPDRARIVMFGGKQGSTHYADTWEWDGTTWENRTPAGLFAARYQHGMTWDPVRRRVVMVGGYIGSLSGTSFAKPGPWEWDGTAWTNLTPSTTTFTNKGEPGLVYDITRGRLVVYAADGTAAAPLWEWNGTAWTNLNPAGTKPSNRRNAGLVYDPARQRTVLYGGSATVAGKTVDYRETWEWNGSTWADRTPTGTLPVGSTDPVLTLDPDGHVLLVVHNNDYDERTLETWEWHDRPTMQPAVQFRATALETGISPALVQGLRVRAHCGGSFTPYSAVDVGASLVGWNTGAPGLPAGSWQPLAANGTGVLAAAPWIAAPPAALLDWTAADADEARRYLLTRDQSLTFQCRPSGTSGVGRASVALDYLEVRLRYRTH